MAPLSKWNTTKILVFVNQKFSFIPKEIVLNSLANLYTKLGSKSKRKLTF